jgi:hypothetical protein
MNKKRKVVDRFGIEQNILLNYDQHKREKYERIYKFSLNIKDKVILACNEEDRECIERNYLKMLEIFSRDWAES